jgi:hypothetical protein
MQQFFTTSLLETLNFSSSKASNLYNKFYRALKNQLLCQGPIIVPCTNTHQSSLLGKTEKILKEKRGKADEGGKCLSGPWLLRPPAHNNTWDTF